MRSVVMINWVSIDGLFAGPNGEIDWILRDPEVDKALRGPKAGETESADSDIMLLGNVTYTMFENFWPSIAGDSNAPEELHKMADEVTRMTKLVFSRTRKQVTWKNSKIINGNLVGEVQKLKQGKGTPILIFGSGTIVQQLTDAGLIDEYFLAVTPVVLGKGKPLFQDAKKRTLKLVEVRYFDSGNVLLRYT
jgi:dihydrofolate reductase